MRSKSSIFMRAVLRATVAIILRTEPVHEMTKVTGNRVSVLPLVTATIQIFACRARKSRLERRLGLRKFDPANFGW
jgi:hypothetical protein